MIKIIETRRDVAERILLSELKDVRPYTPQESKTIDRYKDGSFGLSNIAFALYSNGHNPRGRSSNYPYGLIFEDGQTLFSIGYYRKESDPEDSDGYVFVVAPRGKNAIEKVRAFTDSIISNDEIPCKGVYVRFLNEAQYKELLKLGFSPVDKDHYPWHLQAPQEDETYNSSIVSIDDLVSISEEGSVHINLIGTGSRNSRKKARDGYNRFANFLNRNQCTFSLEEYIGENQNDAERIIQKHFEMLREKGKDIGSTPEDHYNSLDPSLIDLGGVKAYLGYLQKKPVSVFVGEFLSPKRFGLYTPYTLRDKKLVLSDLGIDPESDEAVGFSAISIYAYIRLLEKLKNQGVKEVHLGGSELEDLDTVKRQLGGKSDPSYWVVKLK